MSQGGGEGASSPAPLELLSRTAMMAATNVCGDKTMPHSNKLAFSLADRACIDLESRIPHGERSVEALSPTDVATGAKHHHHLQPTYEELREENSHLKDQISQANGQILDLRRRLEVGKLDVTEICSPPTGKISQIPVATMISIMQDYGSEVTTQFYQPRKKIPKHASIIRQFRRWNPEFLTYFENRDGQWEPKLGKQAELRRRESKRKAIREGSTIPQRSCRIKSSPKHHLY